MNTNFNKIISLIINVNIFCALITLIYFIIDYFHTDTLYSDKHIVTIILIIVISAIMEFGNHFSKQTTLSIISLKSKRNIGFYYESIDTLEYMLHFIYRFCLSLAVLLNLSLWAFIINSIF